MKWLGGGFTNSAGIDAFGAGGSGSPGGSNGQLQFNDAGAFGGDADLSWDKATNTLLLGGADTGMEFVAVTNEPAPPSAGRLRIYARDIAGRILGKVVGPSGLDYPLQPHVGLNNVAVWRGGNATAAATLASVIGSMPYTAASPTAPTIPALADTSLRNRTYRSTISTGATAGGLAFIRGNATRFSRNTGFFVVHRFSLSPLQAGMRAFVGIQDTAANPTNVDPTTTTTPGKIGLAINANTGNWSLVHNLSGAAPTVIPLGASFPVNATDLMELAIFSAPGASSIGYRVTNWSTGAQVSGTISANLPAAATFMTPSVWITNNATAAAATLDFVSTYVETDY